MREECKYPLVEQKRGWEVRSQQWAWQTRDLPHGKLVRENVWSRGSLFNSGRYSSGFKAKRKNTEGRGEFEGKMLMKVRGGVQDLCPTQGLAL